MTRDIQILESAPKVDAELPLSSPKTTQSEVTDRQEDPRWQLAQRIASSGSLGRSRLMADFLLYVVDRHILDRSDEITEQQIGVLVFGRSDGYDSNEDNIVRSYARNLRKRIEEYFSGEGRDEPLRMEIPRGGYVPLFFDPPSSTPEKHVEGVELDEDPLSKGSDLEKELPKLHAAAPQVVQVLHTTEDRNHTSPIEGFRRRWAILSRSFALLVFVLGIVVGLGTALLLPRRVLRVARVSSAAEASNSLWAELFSNDQDTFVVPSDDGLVIMQGLTERPVPLASYVNGSYRTNLREKDAPGAQELLKLGSRRYTSVVDLDFVAHLGQLDQVVPERMMIRYARDLRMEDLRIGNAILLGSVESNPWIELFQSQMNFRYSIHAEPDRPSGITNAQPRAGERAIYGTPGPDHTYGLIAYAPNLTSTGHVLIVGGLNTAGTEAATTFLLTPALMTPILQRAKADRGGLKRFELLIGAGSFAANASAPQLVLERIGAS